MHCHDILYGDHDKDFRCMAAFPLEKLKDKSMYVWKINGLGHLDIDVLVAPRSGEFHEAALVIHRKHMRAIKAPPGASLRGIAFEWEARGKRCASFPCWGGRRPSERANCNHS